MKIAEGQEKRLVENYKATNRQLRKQLQNLNNQVDRIISFKTNRIGLKKLPAVDKSLDKTQDIKMLQLEVDNLRKRLEQLQHDNQNLKVRTTVNHMAMAKTLEDQLANKKIQSQFFKKQIESIDKVSMHLNITDLPLEEMKLYDKIEQANQELIRVKKMEADLIKEMEEKQKNQSKKTDFIQNTVEAYNKIAQTSVSRVQLPITHKSGHNEQEWSNLKKQFLELKQSKIWEEKRLNQDNDRLRIQIRQLQVRLKQKKYTIENIKSLEIRRKQRNYSTIDQQPSKGEDQGYRYRNRNNSYKYNTKA